MVKKLILTLAVLLAVPRFAAAQNLDPSGYSGPGIINVLYRLTIDNDFYFVAREAGVYIWDKYSGAFPTREWWDYTARCAIGNVSNVAMAVPFQSAREDLGEERAQEDMLDSARRQGIYVIVDIHVSGEVKNEGSWSKASYHIIDLFDAEHAAEGGTSQPIPTNMDLLSFYWVNLSADLEKFIEPILQPRLIVEGPPGMRVSGILRDDLIIPDSGRAYIETALPETFGWSTKHKKYADREGVFFADGEHNVLTLPQQKFHRVSLDIAAFQARLPEFDISYSTASRGFFFSAGMGQQKMGLFLQNKPQPAVTSFGSLPILEPRVGIGYRFAAREPHIPKLYMRGALGVRVNYEKVMLDDFSPFSFTYAMGYDWELGSRLRLFAEAGLGIYLLGEDWKKSPSKGLDDSGFVQGSVGNFCYFELPQIRLGLKLPLF